LVEVGSFPANDFGLHDMHGNVVEWVQDCLQDSYAGAPTDGRSVDDTSGWPRDHRGGSFVDNPQFLRSAYRYGYQPGIRYFTFGFRLARTLSP
jgi:formylglycine-generating enzyme required for sulfatase activity